MVSHSIFELRSFFECGWPAYAVLLAAGFAIGVSLTAVAFALMRLRAALVVAGFAMALALSSIAVGALGTFLGERKVDQALTAAAIEPEYKGRIKAEGYAEAAQCTRIGTGFGGLPVALALVACVAAYVRTRAPAPR